MRGAPGQRRWLTALLLVAAFSAAACRGGTAEPTATATKQPAKAAAQPTTPPSPTPEPRYANPELLVSTAWLAEHLDAPDLVVVDARKEAAYKEGHIPGAVSLPREKTFLPPPAPKNLLAAPDDLAKVFGEHGIGNDTRVVVYDEGKSNRGARIFWTLEYLGHTRAALLNGGFKKWQAEGRPVVEEVPQTTPKTFTATVRPAVLSTKEQILADLSAPNVVMLDARSPAEYRGEDVRAKRGGHIPGAVNIDWRKNFTEDDVPVWLPPAELRRLYEDAGVTSDKKVHAY